MEHSKLTEQLLSENPLLAKKIVAATDVEKDEAVDILRELIRFLHLVHLTTERLTPSHKVDMAWHEFILFTKAYADFCTTHFGSFIHHFPDDNKFGNKIGFKKLHYHYEKHLGIKPNPKYWGSVLVEIADESDCGTDLI
jgi:hypothetical protein